MFAPALIAFAPNDLAPESVTLRAAASASSPPHLHAEIIDDWSRLLSLRREWDRLWRAVPNARVGQSFEWAQACWELALSPRGAKLCCVAVWEGELLKLLWPLAAARQGAWRVARPLNSQTSEYSSILAEPLLLEKAVALALVALTRSGLTDALMLPDVRSNEPLAGVLSNLGFPVVRSQSAPLVRKALFPSFDRYEAHVRGKLKSELRRQRRRLEARGRLEFSCITHGPEAERILSWTLLRKREWLLRDKIRNNWMPTAWYSALLQQTLPQVQGRVGPCLFALKLDGELIAAEYSHVDAGRVESFIGAYDPAFAWASPGQILQAECIRWALDRGLDYDFRIGDERYKARWTFGDAVELRTFALVTNRWGRLYLALSRLGVCD